MLSTALNSNALNVAAGFFLPAVIVGVARGSSAETLMGGWYAVLTVVVLVVVYIQRGLRRPIGWLVIAAYVAFVVVLTAMA